MSHSHRSETVPDSGATPATTHPKPPPGGGQQPAAPAPTPSKTQHVGEFLKLLGQSQKMRAKGLLMLIDSHSRQEALPQAFSESISKFKNYSADALRLIVIMRGMTPARRIGAFVRIITWANQKYPRANLEEVLCDPEALKCLEATNDPEDKSESFFDSARYHSFVRRRDGLAAQSYEAVEHSITEQQAAAAASAAAADAAVEAAAAAAIEASASILSQTSTKFRPFSNSSSATTMTAASEPAAFTSKAVPPTSAAVSSASVSTSPITTAASSASFTAAAASSIESAPSAQHAPTVKKDDDKKQSHASASAGSAKSTSGSSTGHVSRGGKGRSAMVRSPPGHASASEAWGLHVCNSRDCTAKIPRPHLYRTCIPLTRPSGYVSNFAHRLDADLGALGIDSKAPDDDIIKALRAKAKRGGDGLPPHMQDRHDRHKGGSYDDSGSLGYDMDALDALFVYKPSSSSDR